MINQKKFHECLQEAGIDFITGVPDSLLNEFCLYAEAELPPDSHIIAANEGNAVALAAGHYLATGKVPLVYMQNSGIGNATNPLLSLTDKNVYAIPLVLLIGWRGDPDIKDHAQHKKQGELTPVLLEAMGIPFKIIENDDESAFDSARWAVSTAKKISGPTALIAKKNMFEEGKKKDFLSMESKFGLSREKAIECLLKFLPDDTVFVATTGRATRELHELRNLNGGKHDRDILNVGAMGHASSIALGIALAKKNQLVVCLDGDASAIMHMGSLAVTGSCSPSNFLHVVLNNGAHESVGGQNSVGFKVDFTAIAENTGYKTIGLPVDTEQNLKNAINTLLPAEKAAFIDLRIRKGIRSDIPPLNVNYVSLKNMFMKSIKKID